VRQSIIPAARPVRAHRPRSRIIIPGHQMGPTTTTLPTSLFRGAQLSGTHRSSTTRIQLILGATRQVTANCLTRKQVAEQVRQRLSDPRYIRLCAKEAEDMKDHNVTKGTRSKRVRIQGQLASHSNNPLSLIRMWEKNYAPSTAKGYTSTLLGMNPEFKSQRKVLDAQDRIKQKAPLIIAKRARPITPKEFQLLFSSAPLRVSLTAMMMLLSASRHMDLLKVIRYRHFIHAVVMLQWANMKSDRYGVRAVSKFIEIPKHYLQHVQSLEIATYREVYYELKKVAKDLSVHSIRRSAATNLAEAGFSNAEIQSLTGHTPTADPHLAVRQYIDPSPNQPESQLQIRMSQALAKIFGLHHLVPPQSHQVPSRQGKKGR